MGESMSREAVTTGDEGGDKWGGFLYLGGVGEKWFVSEAAAVIWGQN